MTLIGPRPERPAFCAEFEKRIHGWHYRTMVTPGLSGLAQVTGGYDLLPKEKVVLDLWQAYCSKAPLPRQERHSLCYSRNGRRHCLLMRETKISLFRIDAVGYSDYRCNCGGYPFVSVRASK
ncbi:MAG: hypothetical protein EGQ84_00505 [Slackia sp.]|nr:hypothetical protein [Slackia sp.]